MNTIPKLWSFEFLFCTFLAVADLDGTGAHETIEPSSSRQRTGANASERSLPRFSPAKRQHPAVEDRATRVDLETLRQSWMYTCPAHHWACLLFYELTLRGVASFTALQEEMARAFEDAEPRDDDFGGSEDCRARPFCGRGEEMQANGDDSDDDFTQ